ncbi:MAG: ABC transporter permease [Janthinobacterium lividum]
MPADRNEAPRQPWVPLLGVAILAAIGFAALNDHFLTSFNLYVILSSATLLALIGYSQLLMLGIGDFSLAVGGIGEFTGIMLGFLLHTAGWPLLPALLVAMLAALCAGVLNGALVIATGVSGFIVTLATGGGFAGLSLAITETTPYTSLPAALNALGTGRIGPLPLAIIIALAAAVCLGVLYGWRRAGRLMLAVGDNPNAAGLSGLSRREAVLWANALSGLLAGLAGIVATAQLHEANPTVGSGWLIQSFTIPIIGGTLLTGGVVSVSGILVAALILATINDGLILLNIGPYWVTLVEGLLVFAAVLLGRSDPRRLFAHLKCLTPSGSVVDKSTR